MATNRQSITDQCLILDLDECLVATMPSGTEAFEKEVATKPEYEAFRWRTYHLTLDDVFQKRGTGTRSDYWGVTRPYLANFLNFAFSYFKCVTVWSAGQRPYVHAIVDNIFRDTHRPDAILTYDDIEVEGDDYHKPIERMFSQPQVAGIMSYHNTFFLDDRTRNFTTSPNNGVTIPPYRPPATMSGLKTPDFALLQFMQWLQRNEIANSRDVRCLDKSKIFTTRVDTTIAQAPIVPRVPTMTELWNMETENTSKPNSLVEVYA